MIAGFLEFLGLDSKTKIKKQEIKVDNIDIKNESQDYIIEMESPYYEEEIQTEIVTKDNKKIEINKIKTKEPIDDKKVLVSVKIYKKDIARI